LLLVFSLALVNLILAALRAASKQMANLSPFNGLCNFRGNELHESESLQSSMKVEASYLIFWMSALASDFYVKVNQCNLYLKKGAILI